MLPSRYFIDLTQPEIAAQPMLWLLAMGVHVQRWKEQASAIAEAPGKARNQKTP